MSINERANSFGLQANLASALAHVSGSDASGSIETDSFTIGLVVHGREHDISGIVEKLISTTNEQAISVFPIVGMGGLGKTTVTKKVFNDERIISLFGDYRVWVYVSENFDVRKILKNILESLTEEKFELDTKEALLKRLQKHLRTKRYLLVLDDVWNEDREMWVDFVNSLKKISSANGSCIIVTSRSERVASIVKTLTVHKLKGLSENDCWSIIKAEAFNRSGGISELEMVGKKIARRCKGLPLAAKVVGGLLFEKSRDEWLEIEQNWLSDSGDDKNPISKILKLSYDNLSSPSLKKCFAYCSIFPKGYHIEKQQLIELWMAEGFLQNEHQRSNINMETTGSENLDLLLRNSLLQVVRSDDYDNVTHCNMHDLVHDLAFSILHENVTYDVSRCRYIGYNSRGDILLTPERGQKYVRTLFLSGRVSNIRFSDYKSLRTLTLVDKEDNVEKLPTSVGELKHLRYLDVSDVRYLLDSIGALYHLQTLRASPEWMHDFLKKRPDSLTSLISLRHLHIPRNIGLPPGIGNLTSLQTLPHFHVGDKEGCGCGISELGKLKDLKGKLTIHNLENVHDTDDAMSAHLFEKSGIYMLRLVWDKSRPSDKANDESVLEGLQPHPDLNRLEICGFKGESLSLWEGLNNLAEIKLEECSECEELSMLGHLPHLKSLYLRGLTNVKSIRSSFYRNIDNLRRDTIVFPVLERLELCEMPNLKEWDDVLLFPTLKYLKIYECNQLTRAPSDFPCLEELEFEHMESRLALENICGIKLTSLTRLRLNGIQGLECLPDWQFTNNHNLAKLEIINCPKMTHIVPHLGGVLKLRRNNSFQILEMIKIQSSRIGFQILKMIKILSRRRNCLQIVEMMPLVPRFGGGGAPFFSFRELYISNCLSLRELPDDVNTLNSLEVLEIIWCPELKSIPYPISTRGRQQQQQQQQGFTSLRRLTIKECKGLTSLPIEMLESCAPSLEELTLSELSSINNFAMVIGCLHKMTRLISLVIERVPKFSIGNTLNRSLSLQRLEIGPFSPDLSNDSFNEIVGAMLPQCTSLRRLKLNGMDHWNRLPDQLQHRTSLEKLWLNGFGIVALPEWVGDLSNLEILYLSKCERIKRLPESLGKLSSLKKLKLSNCIMLRYFPTKQAMIRISKSIDDLEIRECRLLLKEKRNKNDDDEVPQIVDSEWPKISHIKRVEVDGHLIPPVRLVSH
ncbi:hypothetical protein CASFOL_012927 [Castilleja foliolosa]|uniref:NB-ARC domain-containing protein n=1 Tax=Castilleja foliolosa TaxID=1961234 RepID=A0ABD3DKB8_9LAMI